MDLAKGTKHGNARRRQPWHLAALLLVPAATAQSHHSTFGIYDAEQVVEISGVVTAVRWRNPHPSYTLLVTDEAGGVTEWQAETGAISALRLRGLDESIIRVGDRITLAGEPSLHGRPEMFARNLLLEDGREVLLSASSRPRWPERPRLERRPEASPADAAAHRAAGIFRVWTSVLGDPASFPMYGAGDYPLTEEARRLKEAWDPRTSPYIGCGQKGMPYVMVTPYPLEIIADGDDIVIRFEEFDARRRIHMTAAQPAEQSYSLFGRSTGRWEGDTLVVETVNIDAPHFYGDGTPQSRAMRTLERFTLDAQGTRLDYELTVEDPTTFTRTLRFHRYWAWQPELVLQPFGCEQ